MEPIRHLIFQRLNNAEYAAFMNGVRALIAKATPGKLEIDTGTLSQFDACLVQLTDIIVRRRSHADTPRITELDVQRDRLLKYIMTSVRYAAGLPLADRREAGISLWLLLRQHRKAGRLPAGQETGIIEGILFDLAKPEYAPLVAALRMEDVVAALKATNDEYRMLHLRRTESLAADLTEYSGAIRMRMDMLYGRIRALAASVSLIRLSPEAENFVRELNQLIGERKTRYKLRMVGRKVNNYEL